MSLQSIGDTNARIMTLDDGRRVVIEQVPSDDGQEHYMAYEIGPVEWKVTVLLNPRMVTKMSDVIKSVLDKFVKR